MIKKYDMSKLIDLPENPRINLFSEEEYKVWKRRLMDLTFNRDKITLDGYISSL